jgi:PQQ-dependent dehydrogenase (methanol/ethanol family)
MLMLTFHHTRLLVDRVKWVTVMKCFSIRLLFFLSMGAAIASAQTGRKVDDTVLRNTAKSGEEWLTYGQNPGETRFSPLNQINDTNVSRLGLAWSFDVGAGGGTQESTPLMWNGTLYSVTNWSIVFALDARSGKEKWRWDPEVNKATVAPKMCCGVVNRGLAIYDGKIFVPVNDGRLEALDAETGKVVWESRVSFAQDNYTLTMAPRIAKGKVLIGVSGAEYPVRGFIAAYDAQTGRQAWKFWTVPGDITKPEDEAMRKAAPTWDPASTKVGAGGTVWDSISYDPDTNTVYFGTGNAGPWPADLRNAKGKDNLYVCSIVAVDADTGKYKWHFQMVPGDSWDYDSVQQLILAELTIKGQKRKVVMQANKNGFFYVLDRVTGQFLSGQPFVPVTWGKGLNEATGKPIVNDTSYYDTEHAAIVTPGPGGAHNWAPMSFNPTTGLVYIPTTAGGAFNYATAPDYEHKPGKLNLGIVFTDPNTPRGGRGGQPPAGGEVATAAAQAAANPPRPAPAKRATPNAQASAIGPEISGSFLIAWDPIAQKERWRAEGGTSSNGGTLTTAGNLVFEVLPNGLLRAYSADKGEKLLEVQTNLRSAMGPPMTYMLDGKQYVSLQGGQGAAGFGFGGGTASPITPKLLTFVLDGKATIPAAPARN